MKTFGIDANPLARTRRTGTEWYLFHLLKNMMKTPLQDGERVLLYSSEIVSDLGELPDGWEWRILNWPLKKGWTKGRLSIELLTRTPNVFFSPAHEIPKYSKRTKIVSTVHDVSFRVKSSVYSEEELVRQEIAVQRQIDVSDKIIAVSESTKSDLKKYYDVDPSWVEAIHISADSDRFMAHAGGLEETMHKYQLNQGEYFFFLGRLEAKKNIANLVRAFIKYAEKGKGDLVLGGKFGFGEADIRRVIDSTIYKDRIKLLGYVPDADVPALMTGALAYALPSWSEGFGIPALEAMLSGTPLLASDIPALHEVAEDAALYAAPDDIALWAENMKKVEKSKTRRGTMVVKGSARARDFSWEETAQLTWQVLRNV